MPHKFTNQKMLLKITKIYLLYFLVNIEVKKGKKSSKGKQHIKKIGCLFQNDFYL